MRDSRDWPSFIRDHKPGMTLDQPLYLDSEVYEAELERFLGSHWMIVGHVSQVPSPGDYFLVEVFGASIIVVRDPNGSVNALHNVCRHRGAKICEAAAGRSTLFRCRYHGWSYRLNGELAAWRHMPESVAKQDHGLRRCAVAQFQGLILLSLDPGRAPDTQAMLRHVEPYWARYALADCKVAATREYRIEANWKLGIENNLECYHCLPCHPEYTASNAFVKSDEKISQAAVEDFAAYQADWRAGMEVRTGASGMVETAGQPCRAGTWPLSPGCLTASKDGQGVAPLLGTISAYDESVTTGCFGFLSYVAAMCDYALAVSYLPQSVSSTLVVMRWLVRADAQEGRDYQVPDLIWLWDETTKQDKSLIELNAAGVASRGYTPGPYSALESMTADFIARYLKLMSAAE